MLKLTREDQDKIHAAVMRVLECSDKDKVFVNFNDLCEHLDVDDGNHQQQIVIEEISDLLTCNGIADRYGIWQFMQFDGNVYLFAQLWKPGVSCEVLTALTEGTAAAYAFGDNWPRYTKRGRKPAALPNVYPIHEPAKTETVTS